MNILDKWIKDKIKEDDDVIVNPATGVIRMPADRMDEAKRIIDQASKDSQEIKNFLGVKDEDEWRRLISSSLGIPFNFLGKDSADPEEDDDDVSSLNRIMYANEQEVVELKQEVAALRKEIEDLKTFIRNITNE